MLFDAVRDLGERCLSGTTALLIFETKDTIFFEPPHIDARIANQQAFLSIHCNPFRDAASDTLGMTKVEREEFIAERLTSGSLGLEQTRKVMLGALNLAKAKLQEHGVEPPSNWDADHLVTPPSYARAFAEVVDRVVADGHRARMLPLALELRLFGYAGDERGSSGLIKRVGFAMPMTGLIRGFAVQSLGLPGTWTQGPVTHFKDLRRAAEEGNGSTEAGESPALPGIKV